MWRRRFVVLVIAAVVGCIAVVLARGAYAVSTLRSLENGDPVEEATAARQRGDRRLLAVQAFSLYAPGAPAPYDHRPYEWADGVRVIPFTSDAPYWGWERRLMRAAQSYALRYNAVIADTDRVPPRVTQPLRDGPP